MMINNPLMVVNSDLHSDYNPWIVIYKILEPPMVVNSDFYSDNNGGYGGLNVIFILTINPLMVVNSDYFDFL